MKSKYHIFAEPRAARLYLYWEFGLLRGREKFRELQRTGAYVDMTPVYAALHGGGISRKSTAEQFAARIREIACYQVGRMGKPACGFLTRVV